MRLRGEEPLRANARRWWKTKGDRRHWRSRLGQLQQLLRFRILVVGVILLELFCAVQVLRVNGIHVLLSR